MIEVVNERLTFINLAPIINMSRRLWFKRRLYNIVNRIQGRKRVEMSGVPTFIDGYRVNLEG